MRCPFPGIDPWLEQPGVWKNLHTSLITGLRDHLTTLLAPRYFVDIEQRTYITSVWPEEIVEPDVHIVREPPATYAVLEMDTPPKPQVLTGDILQGGIPVWVTLPEVEVVERFLEVRKPKSGEVITVIEILSPTNKRTGIGRTQYEAKRQQILQSQTHLLEIDLLREGKPMFFAGPPQSYQSAYRILVSRAPARPRGELFAFGIREKIPAFSLPLLPGDVEPAIELTPLFHGIYERARYDLVMDYTAAPTPPLSPEEMAWAVEWLEKAKAGA
ncbi:MAG: DUF4058 family protein [Anaerolineales bacterium]|nr:DUF4058 family protein [Anaerolineales bacterium]